MNKLAIPIALVAVIMVAGIFAFSPVEQASTVHDDITDSNAAIADLLCTESELTGVNEAGDNCIDAIPGFSTLIVE